MTSLESIRGGSWFVDAWLLRVSCRLRNQPEARNDVIGFRLIREDKSRHFMGCSWIIPHQSSRERVDFRTALADKGSDIGFRLVRKEGA